MFEVYAVVVSPLDALSMLATYKAARIADISNELECFTHETGKACPLSPDQLYDLEVHQCLFDFNIGAVDVTAIYI